MKKKNYINNKDFYDAIVQYHERLKKHREEKRNTPEPRIPDYIGECFMLLARKIASRPNFSGYTYRDEMIDDGIENCVIGFHSFNPEKYQNPFSYFTQIIWFAFLRRIAKEEKHSYIKHKMLINASMNAMNEGSLETINIDDDKAANLMNKFEKKIKKPKAKKSELEKLLDPDTKVS